VFISITSIYILLTGYNFSYAGSGYDSIIPDVKNAESHQLTKTLGETVGKLVDQYLDAMEKVIQHLKVLI